jgi:hypothetical protein
VWCDHAEEWRTLNARWGHKIYIHGTEKRRVVVVVGVVVVAVEKNSGVYKEAERRSRKCIVEEYCIERI